MTFAPEPRSVGQARHQVEEFLEDRMPVEVRAAALLLVSELSSNAVRHARTPFVLSAELRGGCLHVEVEDGSDELPVVVRPHVDAFGGRGMFLVDGMSSRWDAEHTEEGKRVWFELDAPAANT